MDILKRLRKFSPVLALIILSIIAGQPLLSKQVSGGHDTSVHFWRAVEAGRLLQAGILWPRWSPTMAWGYGYPLFIFQGALSAQITALLTFAGLSWPLALNGVYFLGLLGSALSLYLLARELWDNFGGWCSAALVLFIPYHLYVVYYRASLSETLALVFPPWVLWGLTRWMQSCQSVNARGQTGLICGTLAMAALAMSHPVSFYLFMPLFVAWAVAEAWSTKTQSYWGSIGRAALFLGLGTLLSAFVWLPALLERDYVQLARSTMAWVFTYEANFLPVEQLFALPRYADPLLVNDWPARGVGLLITLAAVGGMATWPTQSRRGRAHLCILGLATVACLWVSTAWSRPLWDALPVLGAFQFPWRFLAPASLTLALLAGAGFQRLVCTRHRWGFLSVLVLVGFLIVAHWGWLYPPEAHAPTPPTATGMLAWEQSTNLIGTTASQELLPRWVKDPPEWDTDVVEAIAQDEIPTRLDSGCLPKDARVREANYRLLDASVIVESPMAFQARWYAFYYPGWQVKIDGTPVPAMPETQTGLITFSVPAGIHTIQVRFGETLLRRLADGLSGVAFIVIAIVAWRTATVDRSKLSNVCTGEPANYELRREPQVVPAHESSSYPTPNSHPLKSVQSVDMIYKCRAIQKWYFIFAILLLLLKIAIVDWIPTPLRYSRLRADVTVAGVVRPLDVNFGGRARLLGIDPPPMAFPADASPLITFYWRRGSPEGRDWRMGVALTDADGARRSPEGLRSTRWGRAPSSITTWPSVGYAQMTYYLDTLPGTPPGLYTLSLSLFDKETLAPASVLGADGNPIAPEWVVDTVMLTRPRQVASLAELGVAETSTMQICAPLGLWDMTTDRVQAAPGEIVALRWVWETVETPSVSLTVTLAMADVTGHTVRTWTLPPVATWWPTDQWQVGERWVGQPVIRVPGSVESGMYHLQLYLPGCMPLASVPLNVVAPERVWTVPPDFTRLDAILGGTIQLSGYQISTAEATPGEQIQIDLAWQARAEIEIAYRVFVHLTGEDGRLWAQHDGEPANWTRPTPGWAVDEVIVDSRVLPIPADIPPGAYQIRVGLYLLNGPRLTTDDGEDAIQVETLRIQ
ncbi:MAG: hypothetical protein JXA33_26980 [Anaerolineae bacterium]|nr:hypothetical protein [Anaerolineae bacterium]